MKEIICIFIYKFFIRPRKGVFFMFTGIITNLGKFKKVENNRYTFETDPILIKKLKKGSSIAVNGVCLTVDDPPIADSFSVTIMPETQKRTMLSSLQKYELVNLELPMMPENYFSGHVVQGHVDGTGKIKEISKDGNSRVLKIEIDENLNKYIVEKASITLNGISLTVIKNEKNYFTVGIIPFTWENTMLQNAKINDMVNIEADILAKYIEKYLESKKI